MNTSDAQKEKLKTERAAQRHQAYLARIRADRAKQVGGQQRTAEQRRQVLEQARDQRVAEENKRAQAQSLLAQLRGEKRADRQSAGARESQAQQQIATRREQDRANQRQAAQRENLKQRRQQAQGEARRAEKLAQQGGERQPLTESEVVHARAAQIQEEKRRERRDQTRLAQRQSERSKTRLDTQREEQRQERLAAQANAQRDQDRRECNLEDRRAERADQLAQGETRVTQRQTALRQARLDAQREEQRQARVAQQRSEQARQVRVDQKRGQAASAQRRDEVRAGQLDEHREQRRAENSETKRRAELRATRLDQQSEQRRQADTTQQHAQTLRAQAVERRRTVAAALDAEKQKRAQIRADAGLARRAAQPVEPSDTNLTWLSVSGNTIFDENRNTVYLRGVNIVGLDDATLTPDRTLSDALGVDDQNLSVLTDLWGVNIVRLPFSAQTILTASDDWFTSLDDLIDTLAGAGTRTLLMLRAPVVGGIAVLPNQDAFDCWRLLANRYQDMPSVLYEIYSAAAPLPDKWLDIAPVLIGTIRKEHPASLLFVSSANASRDVAGLPLRFTTGDPVHDLVYTLRVAPDSQVIHTEQLRVLAHAFPMFASEWSDGDLDLGRASEFAATLFASSGIGWTAANWNAEPRLVINAAAHDFSMTRFGLTVRRALAEPVRPDYTATSRFLGGERWAYPS